VAGVLGGRLQWLHGLGLQGPAEGWRAVKEVNCGDIQASGQIVQEGKKLNA
jgi:hypothetical protein